MLRTRFFAVLCPAMLLPRLVAAPSAYFNSVFFDNSLTPDRYFYSAGTVSAPSQLELLRDKLPVDSEIFRTPPNAIRLHWKSVEKGGWDAELRLYEWRNRYVHFTGDTLRLECYAMEPVRSAELPRLALKDKAGNFTRPLDLQPFVEDLPAKMWTEITIPVKRFASASIHPFDPSLTNTILFVQGNTDGVDHTLILDEIRIEDHLTSEAARVQPLPVVKNVRAKGYELHADVTWDAADSERVARYVIYRSLDEGPFRAVGIQAPGIHRYSDFVGQTNRKLAYRVAVSDSAFHESTPSFLATTATHYMSDDQLLTMVQEACFRYYWEAAHPDAGMTRENYPGDDDAVALGASGFGIMALVVGVERGFITREQGLERLRRITTFLAKADRYHGAWPHFLNGHTGRRMPIFGIFENGADLVETAFLMQGLLTARQYFKGSSPQESQLDAAIGRLWDSVEWDWFRHPPQGNALIWHWSPEYTWHIDHQLTGWNEVMITYLLAIASPAHNVPPSLYYKGWAGIPKEYLNGKTYFGIKLDLGTGTGGPLFFTQYSYLGFDPHVTDRFTDYFYNNRNMARINRAYCVRNAKHYAGYGDDCWGITAVDGPQGYVPYEPTATLDDGTIAPTGALASFPYTPDASMQALKFFYRKLGGRLWDIYGFRDAFNLQQDWFSGIYMGLNQAPITVMIENYRTGLLWKNFMANPEAQAMIRRVGFIIDSGRKPTSTH